MSAVLLRKGWCPTAFAPMQSGDGWLVRIKPRAAMLSAEQARALAQAATRFGSGQIDLTARANLQARGLSEESASGFAEAMVKAGLAVADPALERILNCMASPLGAFDPTVAFDTQALAAAFERRLAADLSFQALPDKFGILLDAGGLMPLSGVSADIMARAAGGRIALTLDGPRPADGERLGAVCAAPDCIEAIAALIKAFIGLAPEAGANRMRDLVERVGEAQIFAAAGLTPVPLLPEPTPTIPKPIGFAVPDGAACGVFGIGLPFGRIGAGTLSRLAGIAEEGADATLRTTPWRALALAGIEPADAPALADKIATLGLITDPDDPRRSIKACVGAPACARATVDTRADAEVLAAQPHLRGLDIHLSGCAKSCAYRGASALTLVGREGRYDLIANGSAADQPERRGLSLAEIVKFCTEREPA